MGKGSGAGGNATTAVRRSGRVKAQQDNVAGADAPTQNPVKIISLGNTKGDTDFAKDERDRPERFDGPEPVLPTKWWHGVHHMLVLAVCVILQATSSTGFFHSIPLTLAMMWYGDAYTAVLHCALDRPECLSFGILNGAARGFQAHHEFPYASTRGRGVYRMICDTHRIQCITIASALVFGRWNEMTVRVCLMKLVVSAYGGATGHFYAHGGGSTRPSWVKFCQKNHLLLSPKHHVGGHHVAPHGINFGIVNGWSNRVMNFFLNDKSPGLNFILITWAALSLYDVAAIERLVVPGEKVLGEIGAEVWGFAVLKYSELSR
ncbi:fatty acid desaturase family protein [bacterium]|nr:fatty acid desaturase family protein [bacterium]MDB9924888.1 fatty acid desaturase family protein [bacterium]